MKLKALWAMLKPWRDKPPSACHDFRDPSWTNPYDRKPDMGGKEVKPLRNNVIEFGRREGMGKAWEQKCDERQG